jgi:glycosyltransferase involved in cell wall biosynthesis
MKDMRNKNITVSFMTCKRFELFERTFDSFFAYCKDLDLIKHIIIVDDNSSAEDLILINKKLENINIPSFLIHKKQNKGQSSSVNLIYSICNTEYLFNIEDDFEFIRGGNFLTDSMEVINKHNHIKRVGVELDENKAQHIQNFYTCTSGEKYYIEEWEHGKNQWPSFSFRQSLIHVPSHLKNVGLTNGTPTLSHDNSLPTTETDYGMRYCMSGYRSAFFLNTYCKENSGGKPSSFILNGVNRHKEQ